MSFDSRTRGYTDNFGDGKTLGFRGIVKPPLSHMAYVAAELGGFDFWSALGFA